MDKFIKIGAGAWGPNWRDPYRVLHTQDGLVKLANEGRFHPDIENYLSCHTFDPGKIVLVVTPLGVFEAWGENSNGDSFLRVDIEPANPEWGHLSFKTYAKAYQHHQNKDIAKSFGHIPCAVFDSIMQRIELVFVIDRERAKQVGANMVVSELDGGRRPDLSMGCFPAGTQITLGDSTRKPIEDIQVGDLVLTHKGNVKNVTKTYCRDYKGDLVCLNVTNNENIRATPQHPFWASKKEDLLPDDRWTIHWVHSGCLGEGDYVTSPAGSTGTIFHVVEEVAIEFFQGQVYNFEVDEDESYVANGLSVHNCKVAFDECGICHQQSKSTLNYCHHLRHQMRTVFPDGGLAHAINPKPRFFDLSFVLIRAAKEAAILQKVASETGVLPDVSMAQLIDIYKDTPPVMAKVASRKLADVKLAELEKHFPDVYYKVVKPLYDSEEPIDDTTLDRMSEFSLPKILASTAASGIVLRPREFQKIYLCRTGHPDLADQYHRERSIFRDAGSSSDSYNIRPEDISDSLLSHLMDWIPKRSALQPFVSKRIVIISIRGPKKMEPEMCEKTGSILDEVGREYAKYITGLAHLPSFLKSAMVQHSELYDIFAAESFDPMRKTATFAREVLLPAAAIVLPVYLLAAKWKGEEAKGEDLGMIQSMIAHHPTLASVGLLTGFHRLGKL